MACIKLCCSVSFLYWNILVLQVGFNHLHECLGVGFDVLVDQYFSLLIQYADIEASGMQINSAVMLMCLGVEFH